VRQQLRAGEAG